LIGLFRARGAAILMYHSVGRKNVFWDNVVSPERFEEQVRFLSRRCTIVPMSRLVERLAAGGEIPSDWVVLTFDDGYGDNADRALPILRRRGATATFFATVDVVANGMTFFYDSIQSIVERTRAEEIAVPMDGKEVRFKISSRKAKEEAVLRMVLGIRNRHPADRTRFVATLERICRAPVSPRGGRPIYLRGKDVRLLESAGMEIGSHTVSHANLAGLGPEELREEVSGSKAALERIAANPVTGFAYPFGKPAHYNDAVKDEVRRAGYRYAVTTVFGRVRRGTDIYAIPRIAVRDASLIRLKACLLGVPL
jgi:peptidoglycan/xylan/chitin deacetylase (PgdA/CDA1 family)